MAVDNAHHARLVEAATATELRHFAQGAAFTSKFATAEGLSKRELGEVAETFVAWKAADKALADYHAESAGAKATKDRPGISSSSVTSDRFRRAALSLHA
jgi:hypothetical protein